MYKIFWTVFYKLKDVHIQSLGRIWSADIFCLAHTMFLRFLISFQHIKIDFLEQFRFLMAFEKLGYLAAACWNRVEAVFH